MPETIFCNTIAQMKGYECQVNIISGKCRIVSPDRMRISNGSRNVMLEKMSRFADKEFLRRGDIIGVSRMGLYEPFAMWCKTGRSEFRYLLYT